MTKHTQFGKGKYLLFKQKIKPIRCLDCNKPLGRCHIKRSLRCSNCANINARRGN